MKEEQARAEIDVTIQTDLLNQKFEPTARYMISALLCLTLDGQILGIYLSMGLWDVTRLGS